MSISDEIARLEDQWRAGTLSDEEFKQAKAQLLSGNTGSGSAADANQWAMWLHLSMLSGFVVPGAGFIAPIVIWQIKKDELPGIDRHGKNATNWLISSLIYGIVFGILTFVLIGIPLLFALAACTVVFPIVAGLKANQGEIWKYPMAIEFFKDAP